ncbi:MAG: hypothetical protein AAGA32_02785 [Pseudomonadota bacterium]
MTLAMYQPENKRQLADILAELQLYAEVEGMACVSEMLSDALVMVVSDLRTEAQKATTPQS